jgi:protein-disulfide isomerase
LKSSGEVKLFVGILIAALALVGVAVYPTIVSRPTDTGPKIIKIDRSLLVPPGTLIRGNPSAPYTVVEFGDYQCPNCRFAARALTKLVSEHKDKVNACFHHVQATKSHTNTNGLAMMVAAARLQGKFWQMHDALFERQDEFKDVPPDEAASRATKLAAELKLDMLRFGQDCRSRPAAMAVHTDTQIADKANVNGTPTFFILRPTGDAVKLFGLQAFQEWVAKPGNLK